MFPWTDKPLSARTYDEETIFAHWGDITVHDLQRVEIFETTSSIRELTKVYSVCSSPLFL